LFFIFLFLPLLKAIHTFPLCNLNSIFILLVVFCIMSDRELAKTKEEVESKNKKRKSRKPKETAAESIIKSSSPYIDGMKNMPYYPPQEPDIYSPTIIQQSSNNKKGKFPNEIPSLPIPPSPSLIRNVPSQLVSSFSIKNSSPTSKYPTYQTPSNAFDGASYILPPRHMNSFPFDYNPTSQVNFAKCQIKLTIKGSRTPFAIVANSAAIS
jgi:hypothetical protein